MGRLTQSVGSLINQQAVLWQAQLDLLGSVTQIRRNQAALSRAVEHSFDKIHKRAKHILDGFRLFGPNWPVQISLTPNWALKDYLIMFLTRLIPTLDPIPQHRIRQVITMNLMTSFSHLNNR